MFFLAPTTCPGTGNQCRSTIVCSSQFPADQLNDKVCKQNDGSAGLCCKDITTVSGNGVIATEVSLGIRNGGNFG
jgi:hypothetical protein